LGVSTQQLLAGQLLKVSSFTEWMDRWKEGNLMETITEKVTALC